MSTMRSLTRGFAGLPDDFGQAESRFGRSCYVPGESLLAYLLGDCVSKAIAAKFGCEKYHKRPENTGDNARGEGAVAWVDPNSLSDRNPAKTHVFTNSCSEPKVQTSFWAFRF